MAKVTIKNVRLAFPSLFELDSFDRYSAAFPIEPGSANHKAIEAAIKEAAKEKWNAKADKILESIKEEGNICYVHKPRKNKDGEIYDGYEGMYSLSAGNTSRPTVIDRDKTPLTAQDGRPYAGCYVVALLEIWAQDNSFGRRINCTLRGVQFYADGEAFGGGAPASADEFEDLSDGADADDLS